MLLDEDGAQHQDPPASRDVIDLLIIGLGPAGARAAAAAASRGARVVAVDRKREPGVPVQCAEFVPALIGSSIDGLGACVRQRIDAMETFVESETPDHTAPFPGQMLDRAGADCRFGVAVRSLARDATVTLSDGTCLVPRVIIGADGPRSIAGRAIGQVNRALVETRQVTVPLAAPHAATDIFLSAAIPGGYGWLFPKGDVANLGAGVAPAHKRALKEIVDSLHERLVAEGRVGRRILARTGGAIPVGGALTPRGRLGCVPVLLAGDAAGLANPVTGAGIAAAAQSGALAGEAAALFLDGHDTALVDYEDELDALFGAALVRALHRREELLRSAPSPAALRRAWIAYPEYWRKADELHEA